MKGFFNKLILLNLISITLRGKSAAIVIMIVSHKTHKTVTLYRVFILQEEFKI